MSGAGRPEPHGDAAPPPQPWRPRIVRLGEAEVEIVWWGPVQLAAAILLALVAVVAVVMIALQSASGDMPWQAAVVVAVIPVVAGAVAGWMFWHREVRLCLDSVGLGHRNRLGGFAVAWDQVRRVELITGRGSPIIQVTAAAALDHTGRRRRDIVVEESSVPAIAAAVEHWTGRPLLVRAAGTIVPWRPGDEPET